jgi:hypothetical protein
MKTATMTVAVLLALSAPALAATTDPAKDSIGAASSESTYDANRGTTASDRGSVEENRTDASAAGTRSADTPVEQTISNLQDAKSSLGNMQAGKTRTRVMRDIDDALKYLQSMKPAR